MKLYRCNKTVLRFYPKATAFLNGYTTNTVDAPLTAFVDIQGRIVAAAHQFRQSDDEVWEVVEDRFVERLLKHLHTYLSLSDTRVETLVSKKVYWDLESKELLVTDEKRAVSASEEEFTLFRVKNAFPLQGVDFDEEMVLNVGEEGLVSYSKGCYLGQEIVARVHYRGRPPKQLVVKEQKDCAPEEFGCMTSKVFDPDSKQMAGFILTGIIAGTPPAC